MGFFDDHGLMSYSFSVLDLAGMAYLDGKNFGDSKSWKKQENN
jgi:hypothetical protein